MSVRLLAAPLVPVLLLALAPLLSGCESTQAKSARLQREGAQPTPPPNPAAGRKRGQNPISATQMQVPGRRD